MDKSAWEKGVEVYVKEQNARKGEVRPAPVELEGPISFPIVNRLVTEDLIRYFTYAIGDANPLWRDREYGRRTRWGGIIAPPLFEACISEAPRSPNPPDVPGWHEFNGGSVRKYFRPFKPGDEIHAVDRQLGIEERSKPDRPHRLFIRRAERTYMNQHDEVICVQGSNILCTATPPGVPVTAGAPKDGRGRERYTEETLEEVRQHNRDEIAGTQRRGAEALYWQDVSEGDLLPHQLKGPYDVVDAATIMGVMGLGIAFAHKQPIFDGRPDPEMNLIDSETGAYHYPLAWHLQDSVAQLRGVPYAPAFGTHLETMMSHVVTNWMGDDGEFVSIDAQVRAPVYYGDICKTSGKVTRKYVEDGRHLVDVEVTSATIHGGVYGGAKVTVALRARDV